MIRLFTETFKSNYHWYDFTLSRLVITKNRIDSKWLSQKLQFVLYLHIEDIELINPLKTNEIGEIVCKLYRNSVRSQSFRYLLNFLLEHFFVWWFKWWFEEFGTVKNNKVYTNQATMSPNFLSQNESSISYFKVWGIKRSGKSLYQILYLW